MNIKSTVPVDYTQSIKEQFNINNIIFSQQFLKKGHTQHDNLYPSHIIVGEKSDKAEVFSHPLQEGAIKENINVLFTYSTEAGALNFLAILILL